MNVLLLGNNKGVWIVGFSSLANCRCFDLAWFAYNYFADCLKIFENVKPNSII